MQIHSVQGGGGLNLHVREWGKADAPAILFLHGWSQHHLCWARQTASALAHEFRLVAPDLRGHGQSEAPLESDAYTQGSLRADDVHNVIQVLGLTTGTLLCGDLFTQVGHRHPPIAEDDIVEPSEQARAMFDYFSHTKNCTALMEKLARMQPRLLACMHGASWRGDGAALLRTLGEKLAA